ncbi:ABC-type transport auxiliary lipoprotein family protein [Oryzifoliimicrobium ureilyticus]|uniref:ABC-type transport auxiliary lipoprotein family protein n=1 Tax=Oryzifoliimicrobium ureilyticus TaxID=3113724 RepID=UPI0030764149
MAVSNSVSHSRLLRNALLAIPVAFALASCGTSAKNSTYDLSIAATTSGPAIKNRQLLIATPTALQALNSEQIVVRVSPAEIQYLGQSQWSDKLPQMVQSKLVEAYENSGKLGGVGVPGQGLAIDYQLVTDIRAFEIEATGGSKAVVEISAKILNDRNGTVRAQKVFRQVVPAPSGSNLGYVKALDRAFSSVASQMVDWTLKTL